MPKLSRSPTPDGRRRTPRPAVATRAVVEPVEDRTLLSTTTLLATTYDTTQSFSMSANPNGVWTYGSLASLAAAPASLAVYTNEGDVGPIGFNQEWYSDAAAHAPAVSADVYGFLPSVAEGTLDLQPGPAGQYSVARFTAPAAGTASVTFTFAGTDAAASTADVHLLQDGAVVSSGAIDGGGTGGTFSGSSTLALARGDTVDFAVGGGGGPAADAGTSLVAQVTLAVPTSADTSVLDATAAHSTVPTSVVAGTKLRGSVSVSLRDRGLAAVTGVDTVDLYAVPAGEPVTAATAVAFGTLVGTAKRRGTVRAGKTVKLTVPVRPTALQAGSYALIPVITDPTGGVSAGNGPGGDVTVIPADVRLEAEVNRVSASAVSAGRPVSLTLQVENFGSVNSTGPASVTVSLTNGGGTLTLAVGSVRGVPKSPTVRAHRVYSVRLSLVGPTAATGLSLYPVVVFSQDGQTSRGVAATPVAFG